MFKVSNCPSEFTPRRFDGSTDVTTGRFGADFVVGACATAGSANDDDFMLLNVAHEQH
jgi:hypothetical protein